MRYIALAILLSIGFSNLHAQEVYSSSGRPVNEKKAPAKKGFDASRIIFGGGLGFGFGTVTNISVSPMVGYRISDNFSAGIRFGYQYIRVKDYYKLFDTNNDRVSRPKTANMYSPSVWARYVIWNNIFAHVEYEHNFMSIKEYYNNNTYYLNEIVEKNTKLNVPSLLIGGGIRQPITERASIIIMGLYDVLQDKNSPYYGSISIRFGFTVGF